MGIGTRLIDMAEAALFTEAEVTGVERIGDDFVRVGVAAEQFRASRWVAGSKVQIRPTGTGRGLRTYTPLSWDAEEGRTELLAYVHGPGPASGWFRHVRASAMVKLMGPRRSIDPPAAGDRIVFVGDETSLALACAFATIGAQLVCLFEAARPGPFAAMVNTAAPTVTADVCGKTELLDRLHQIATAETGSYRLVVTGDAETVHTVRRDVRTWTAPPSKVSGKAYWAAGRTGLD